MATLAKQVRLSAGQVANFYTTLFHEEQAADFRQMVPAGAMVLDLGGGCGSFAECIARDGYRVRVQDIDPVSVQNCRRRGIDAQVGDALDPETAGGEDFVSFNLILHHLVGPSEKVTRALQLKALKAWRDKPVRLFVNEYIYQSMVGQVAPRLIYEITSSKVLSWIGRQVSKAVPALRANTFGVGVRFRSHEQWREMFTEAGFRVVDTRIGLPEPIRAPLRALLIKTIRRDSFLLEPRPKA